MERTRQAAWDKRKLRTVSTHLTAAQYDRLRRVCELEGTTPYKLLQTYLRYYVQSTERRLNER